MNNLLLALNPYMLLIKILSGIALVASLYFAWHFYVVEHYREQGRAELRPKLELANKQVKTLTDDIEKQNIAVNQLKIDSDKRISDSLEALKKAHAISLHKQGNINALQSLLGKIKTCDSSVDAAKAQL